MTLNLTKKYPINSYDGRKEEGTTGKGLFMQGKIMFIELLISGFGT